MPELNCRELINNYLSWLRAGYAATMENGVCVLSTPFLDRHNDTLEILVEQHGTQLLLTDDGYTIGDLRSSGIDLDSERRKQYLSSILIGFGVSLIDDELQVLSDLDNFAQNKHNLVQAMLAVNDLYVTGREHVLQLFKEDVAAFLSEQGVPRIDDLQLVGKSRLPHKFDFALPMTREKPLRVVRAINALNRDLAMAFAFAVSDIQQVREQELGSIAIINDASTPPSREHLSVLEAYGIRPLFWSRREQLLGSLN